MTSVSAGHIIITSNQSVRRGRPERRSKPRPPDKKSQALSTESQSLQSIRLINQFGVEIKTRWLAIGMCVPVKSI